jgi:hypothetical protein
MAALNKYLYFYANLYSKDFLKLFMTIRSHTVLRFYEKHLLFTLQKHPLNFLCKAETIFGSKLFNQKNIKL